MTKKLIGFFIGTGPCFLEPERAFLEQDWAFMELDHAFLEPARFFNRT